MASGLSISPVDMPKVFACPHCGQTINTSASSCPFCLTPMDPQAAERAAASMARISSACNEASYIRSVAGMAGVFFAISFLPIVGGMSEWGFRFVLVACPFMAVRCWIRYRSIVTEDPDFQSARRMAIASGIATSLLIPLYIGALLVIAWWRK